MDISFVFCTNSGDSSHKIFRNIEKIEDQLSEIKNFNIEIVVVLNGSSSFENFRFAFDEEEFQYARVFSEKRDGLIFARNAGVASTTGEVIVFLDDDVEINDHYIEALSKINFTEIFLATGDIFPKWECCPTSDVLARCYTINDAVFCLPHLS